jgi:hypothetical protein
VSKLGLHLFPLQTARSTTSDRTASYALEPPEVDPTSRDRVEDLGSTRERPGQCLGNIPSVSGFIRANAGDEPQSRVYSWRNLPLSKLPSYAPFQGIRCLGPRNYPFL